MYKFDIHSHILPGIDDGASDARESKHMLRMAAEQGILKIIATPHCSAYFKRTAPRKIISICKKAEAWARECIHPKFKIYAGQEILCTADNLEQIKRRKILTLAGSRYLLLEFMTGMSYTDMYRSVREVMATQYVPVLAHVERYRALREEGRIEELLQTGAKMQMNYGAVGGKWHDGRTKWCRRMLKEGNIHVLGTDMHNTEGRKPDTEAAMRWMQKHLEEEYLEELCYKNAERIVQNVTI